MRTRSSSSSKTTSLRAATVAALVTVGAGVSVLAAGTAGAAEPAYGCAYYHIGNPVVGAGFGCPSGTPKQYRVRIICRDGFTGDENLVTGPWRSGPLASEARCGQRSAFVRGGWEFR